MDDQKSTTTGVVLLLARGTVGTIAVKQRVTALSPAKADYVALSKACTMIILWCHLLKTITVTRSKRRLRCLMIVRGACRLERMTSRRKAASTSRCRVPPVRSLIAGIANKVVGVTKMETEFQKADILIKSLGEVNYLRSRRLLLGEY